MYDVAKKHQTKIARQTLRMAPVMANIMGGMTFEQAYEFLYHVPLKDRLQSLIHEYGDKEVVWELDWNPHELLRAITA